jgi:cation diffusion facilitator CzcD-associated flavoprotein CzcO
MSAVPPVSADPVSIVIVGAGFGGLGMAIRLRQAGITEFVILEKAAAIGGVWRDNTYPGAACDVPSHLYSFSFERRYQWSRVYSGQADIARYMAHVCDKHGLAAHLRFNAELKSARFDEERGVWDIETTGGQRLRASILITATGQLNRPLYPDIPGLQDFRGKLFHSSRWAHDYDLRDRRVAVIGTGASAIQFVPQIAKQVAQLHLFQRSPAYVMPKLDHRLSRFQHRLFDAVPFLYSVARSAVYSLFEFLGIGFVRWRPLLVPFRAIALWHMRRSVKDPELRRKLTPDYSIGCKRVLFANDYFAALARPNVNVVTDGIASIGAHEIVTKNGVRHTVDAIILGTGFAANELLAPMEISGRGGLRLQDAWRAGPEAYLGITVAGFPNLFMIYGPNTNLGHNSILYMLESQFRYVLQAVQRLRHQPGTALDVKPEVQARFNRQLQDELGRTVWNDGCHSWYMNDSGRIVNNWSGFTFEYRRLTRSFNPGDYVVLSGATS